MSVEKESSDKAPKQTQDFSAEVKEQLPRILAPVKADPSKFMTALDQLLAFEKKTRLV